MQLHIYRSLQYKNVRTRNETELGYEKASVFGKLDISSMYALHSKNSNRSGIPHTMSKKRVDWILT